MICPACGKSSADRSILFIRDRAVRWFHLKPYLCLDCHREERRIVTLGRMIRWRRAIPEATLYGIGLLMFLAILYYVIQQRIPGAP
jgi:hypothetical protein